MEIKVLLEEEKRAALNKAHLSSISGRFVKFPAKFHKFFSWSSPSGNVWFVKE